MKKEHRHALPIVIAALVALPGLGARLAGVPLDPPLAAAVSGAAIIGASFLLLWACDAAQTEISQALALAFVALIAVLPEYSVDMYFTWQAGKQPASGYAHYAIANMTGANRLLIGVAWGLIVVLYWARFRRPVRLESERGTELKFLGAATLYALVIPIKGSLAWYDGLVFLGIYVAYIVVASRRCCAECEADGPAELLVQMPKARRRAAIIGLFLFSGFVILANSAPFCEGLIGTGKALHINEFVLVQWLAPIASEAPEFVVALMFAWRGQAGLALGSLLSAKLNQWTLLVGMIPGVFALSHGTLAHPIPMDSLQMHEILLTAAQSVLAVVLLAGLRLSIGGALLLFGLFFGQLALPLLVAEVPGTFFGLKVDQIHPVFSFLYFTAAAAILLQRPAAAAPEPKPEACDSEEFHSPHCRTCKWRTAAHNRELAGARN
ncbi:MAG: sodium:calcium antiporter [Acidobacteriota bacterium]